MRYLRQGFLALCLALSFTACFEPERKEPPSAALPVPTKDEVLLVNGRKLSISGYFVLREKYPSLSREDLLWIGTAALAIQNDTQSRGREMTAPAAVELARYALSETDPAAAETLLREYFGTVGSLPKASEFRGQLDRLISQSVVQRNPQVLAELH